MSWVHSYTFHSEWHVDYPLENVWGVLIEAPHFWNEWWPDLESFNILTESDNRIGDTVRYKWRSFLGYSLEFVASMTAYQPVSYIAFDVDGDLRGKGRWEFSKTSAGTLIKIDWQVETTLAWMNVFGVLLKPLFRLSHAYVMYRGEKGLNRYLRANHGYAATIIK